LKICWFSNLTEILSIDEYKFAFSERLIFKSLGEQLFSYIMVRTSYISMRWSSLCARQINTPSWIFIKLAHCNNSTQVDMLLYSNTFPDFEATSLSGEVANTNFIVLGLTWQGLESRSTVLEASMLTITPSMQLMFQILSRNKDARTFTRFEANIAVCSAFTKL
jgi:hypothetical protein